MQQAVRVLVDEPAIDREFTYLLPPELASGRVKVTVGTVVRVVLNRRRLRGWVTALHAAAPTGRELVPISGVVGVGPPPHVVELAGWAAWRWAGTRAHFMRTASSDRVVAGVPNEPASWPAIPPSLSSGGLADDGSAAVAGGPAESGRPDGISTPEWAQLAWARDQPVPGAVRLGPCADEWPLVTEALRHGRLLVLVPTVAWAAKLAGRLRRAGVETALAPRDWARAAVAHAVVGTRSAAWAPCGRLDAVLVLDEHDEAYQSEAAPTWNAREVAIERARRDGARCLLAGPMPSPDALAHCAQAAGKAELAVITAARPAERDAWPRVQIADRRRDDPATGEWCGEALADLLRAGSRVVCVLNRTGRARLAYCNSCGELARSRATGRALRLDKQQFTDPDSGETRPAVCESCGATRFRRARVGVKGVAAEMERLTQRRVVQVIGEGVRRETDTGDGGPQAGLPASTEAALYIGTEAALHRVRSADTVAFVDFDQELMAPRYRAAEEAFALLLRAARLVGPRSAGGRILVQTRLPAHPVLVAAADSDPGDWIRSEYERRAQMRQPPASAWALVSGVAAPGYIENLSASPQAGALDIAGPADGTWRIRSDDRAALLDALVDAERPSGRLRVAVDPMRA